MALGGQQDGEKGNQEINMLSLAAYFGSSDLTKRFIDGHLLTSHDFLCGPPIQIAAQSGHFQILRFHQEVLLKTQNEVWKFEPWSILGASIRGETEMVELALRPFPDAGQTNNNVKFADLEGQIVDTVEHLSKTGLGILDIRKHTPNPKVYDRLTSLLTLRQRLLSAKDSYADLGLYALRGDIGMVRHLLDLGTPVQCDGNAETPITMACRGLHHDIIDLLLQRGADLHFHAYLWPVFAFHEAAVASSLSLVRKLLSHGANPNRGMSGALKGGVIPGNHDYDMTSACLVRVTDWITYS
jgi:ankyrin repeat protein